MKKILIIEDDTLLRENIATYLSEEGYETFVAENGRNGLRKVQENIPDLILCDISMPLMNGYEVYSALQEDKTTALIPFIFLTAKVQREEIRKGMDLGVDDYLTKPFLFEELLRAVNSRLDKQEKIFKINEENYRVMIENSLTGIFIIQEEKFVFVNSKFLIITGYTANELMNSPYQNIFVNEDFELKRDIELCIKQDKKIFREYNVQNKKGKMIFLEMYGGQIRYDNKLSFIGIVIDVTQRKNFEKLLFENMILTEEKERKRFADDLHDGLGPLLYSIKLNVDLIKLKSESQPEIKDIAKNIDEMILTAIDSTKEIANNLTPSVLEDYGLVTAIKKFIEKLTNIGNININFNSDMNGKRFNKSVEITLYRVITELLNNTLKHAQAKKINIYLKNKNDLILLNYNDDGIGIKNNENQTTGNGMKNIEARLRSIKGKLEFISNSRGGFNVIISVLVESDLVISKFE